MNNLIEERDERTRKRKKIKRKMDSIIGLSNDTEKQTMKLSVGIAKMADNTIRLLDEGYFDSGFVIKKGTLEKYLNGQNQYVRGYEMTDDGWQMTDVLNLTDDFVGTVNIGHMEFATFPFIVGDWTKKDLSLVDIENDRKGIDVSVNLDEESIFIQELKRQPFDIGISSEFYYHINDEDTESLSEMLGEYMPVIDEVFIFAYGLVGECGNVNSSGLELKGVDMSKEIKELMAVDVELENAEETIEEIEEIEEQVAELGVEEIDITANEEAEEEASEEDAAEESDSNEEVEPTADDAEDIDEEEAEEEDSDEEDEIEEVSDADEEEEVEEADDPLTEALALIKALKAENAGLKDMVAELKKSNRRVNKKLAKEKELKERFLAETANLYVELLPNELEAANAKAEEDAANEYERNYILTGGVADI